MIYDTIAPCKKKKGYEGIPDEFYQIPLKKVKETLLKELHSYEVLRETKVMVVFKEEKSGNKISIYPSLRTFIHGDVEEDEAIVILDKISKSIEKIKAS